MREVREGNATTCPCCLLSHISDFWKAPLISQLFIDWELNPAPSRETRVAFEPFCCQVFHGLSVKSLTCVLFSEKRECAVHGAPSALLKRVWIPAWHWVGACTHSTRQQGLLCSYRIHECMLNTARKGHSLSSAKPTAPLSTSTPYAWEIKTHDCLFFFQLSKKKRFLFNVWVSENLCYLLRCFLSRGTALFWWITIAFPFACLP